MYIHLDRNGVRHRVPVVQRYPVKAWLRAFATIKGRVDDGNPKLVAAIQLLREDRQLLRIFRRMIKQAWRDSYVAWVVGDVELRYSDKEGEREWRGEMPLKAPDGSRALVRYHEFDSPETRTDDENELFEGYSYLVS